MSTCGHWQGHHIHHIQVRTQSCAQPAIRAHRHGDAVVHLAVGVRSSGCGGHAAPGAGSIALQGPRIRTHAAHNRGPAKRKGVDAAIGRAAASADDSAHPCGHMMGPSGVACAVCKVLHDGQPFCNSVIWIADEVLAPRALPAKPPSCEVHTVTNASNFTALAILPSTVHWAAVDDGPADMQLLMCRFLP